MNRDPAVVAARAQCQAARARLDASIAAAKDRLHPRSLAADAVEGAADKAVQVAQNGLDAARERPALSAAIAGALALALFRKPLLGWISRRADNDDATGTDDVS